MSDTPETQEAVERWRQGKINIFDEMARLERERDEALKTAAMWEKVALREATISGARICGKDTTK